MEYQQELVKQLHTIRDYLRWAVSSFNRAELFYGHGTDNAWDEALQLLMHTLNLPLDLGEQVLDARLSERERACLLELIEIRVRERIPLPYLTGEAWFAGFNFKVDERVLIPRSPIAELIEHEFQPWAGEHELFRIMDLCTGGGCIGIATALYLPEATVDLVDISEEALEVAAVNIERYQLSDRVQMLQSDLFEAVDVATGAYDLIVSNPPYVDKRDIDTMPDEFHHEPSLALAAGHDGLDIAKRILAQAPDYLSEQGLLVLEVGNSGMTLEEQYPDIPFTWIEFERGGHGVMVFQREELLQYRDRFI